MRDELERMPFLDVSRSGASEKVPQSPGKGIWYWFAVLISLSVGEYTGTKCATMQEAWLYGGSFCGEALLCTCVSGIVRAQSFKRSIFAIGIWFTLSGVAAPIAGWFDLQFRFA
jgi:hypothetical protein